MDVNLPAAHHKVLQTKTWTQWWCTTLAGWVPRCVSAKACSTCDQQQKGATLVAVVAMVLGYISGLHCEFECYRVGVYTVCYQERSIQDAAMGSSSRCFIPTAMVVLWWCGDQPALLFTTLASGANMHVSV